MDSDDNLYVVGDSGTTNEASAFALRRYDAGGTLIWRTLQQVNRTNADLPHILLLNGRGRIYVAGAGGVFQFDLAGQPTWAMTNLDCAGACLSTDGLVVTGYPAGARGSQYVTESLKDDGVREWVARFRTFPVPLYPWDDSQGVAIDQEGRVYVTGRSGGAMVTLQYLPLPPTIRLTQPRLNQNQFAFGLQAPAGLHFRIQVSDDLFHWTDWNSGASTNGRASFSAPVSEFGARFYRAIVE